MLFPTLLATFAATASAVRNERTFAVLRHVGDGPVMTCRADPIISPGAPSAHVHTFFGANNVGLNTTGEDLRRSTCTTALPKADLSAYWFPKLYFKDPSTGKLEGVPFFYMNVYYFFDATNDDLKAFPLGLNLVSGSAGLRTPPVKSGVSNLDPSKGTLSPAQITCPRPNFDPPSWPAGSDGSMAGIGDPINKGVGIGFPFQDCDGYASPMRVDVHFPSCYNPAAGLTNQKSNSAFPTDAGNGKLDCPKGWIHVPHMFFESYWDTHKFASRFQSLAGKESPFVFANGDVTGFSAHADFISGWDEKALQAIIDNNCNTGHAGIHTCPGLTGGVNPENQKCHATCPVSEDVEGPFDKLPGNNPLSGWKYGSSGGSGGSSNGNNNPSPQEPATSAPGAPAPTPTTTKAAPTTFVYQPTIKATESSPSEAGPETTQQPGGKTTTVYETKTVYATKTVYGTSPSAGPSGSSSGGSDISGFKAVGCYKDSRDRVLSGDKFPSLGPVSNTKCVAHCDSKGFTIAGTEYGGECFCGNSLSTIEKLSDSECNMPCKGAGSETCGGSWALTLYTKGGVAPSSGNYKRHLHDHFMSHRRSHFRR